MFGSHSSGPGLGPLSIGEEETVEVVRVFVDLSRQLRQLRDLPLEVATVQGSSPIFRHTEVVKPV